jgi:hypothetical protein
MGPGIVEDIQDCVRSKGVPVGGAAENAVWDYSRMVTFTGPGNIEARYRTLGAPGVAFTQRRQTVTPIQFI